MQCSSEIAIIILFYSKFHKMTALLILSRNDYRTGLQQKVFLMDYLFGNFLGSLCEFRCLKNIE